MENAELLSQFKQRVEEFERYQGFIDRARSQASRFAPAVIEKVVTENTAKCEEVAQLAAPMLMDLEASAIQLESEKLAIMGGRGSSDLLLQELELRLAIGEMTEEQFQESAAELQSSLGTIDQRVAEVDSELTLMRKTIEQWANLVKASGMAAVKHAPKVEVIPPPVSLPENNVVMLGESDDDSLFTSGFEEDLIVVSTNNDEPMVLPMFTDDAVIIDEPLEDLAQSPIFQENAIGDVDEALHDFAESPGRRAVLLGAEATPEEQVYEFVNDKISLGRGRDNDIQVKNDSKVSRYHCEIYRRGPNYYIEDKKSANGTLVNGELITERRLFGGEEVIIGETFFRFRILD